MTDVPAPALWTAGFAGAAIGLCDARTRRAALVAATWTLGSWLRVKVDGYFYPHHYYPALPGLAAGIAIGATAAPRRVISNPGALLAAVVAPLFTTFVASPQLKALRELPWERGGSNDGLAYAASAYLKRHSAPEDRIFVSGCEPAVLWLADRLAPSRLFDIFPLLHHKPYASERAQTLLEHPPRYVCALPTTPEQDPQFDLLMGQRRYEPVWDSAGGVIYRLAED